MGDAMAPLAHDLWTRTEIKCDLLKLENQIPFRVIEALYSLLGTGGHDLVDLALDFFSGLTHGDLHSKREKLQRRPTDEVKHLLHLYYTSLLPPSEDDELQPSKDGPRTTMVPEWFPSATELWNVGVRFRRKETASNFLEIKFDEGVMDIPPLHVHDCSNSIFRNLMTFEQGLPVQPYITTYSMFMDCILRTSEDARLLQLSGIVLNRQGSDEDLSRFFSRLCRRIHHVYETDHLQKIFSRVREYHDRRWLRWQVSLARRYLRNPWIVVSVASATVLLLLTMEQAFFAALSYVHH